MKPIRPREGAELHPLHHLAANLSALIGRSMDIGIPLSRHQIGDLGWRQDRLAFDRAGSACKRRHLRGSEC